MILQSESRYLLLDSNDFFPQDRVALETQKDPSNSLRQATSADIARIRKAYLVELQWGRVLSGNSQPQRRQTRATTGRIVACKQLVTSRILTGFSSVFPERYKHAAHTSYGDVSPHESTQMYLHVPPAHGVPSVEPM
jgi:hypothetical protein